MIVKLTATFTSVIEAEYHGVESVAEAIRRFKFIHPEATIDIVISIGECKCCGVKIDARFEYCLGCTGEND